MGILGVILGILAVVCAALATFLFGTTGCIIAVVLAAVAILLGVLATRPNGLFGSERRLEEAA